MQAARRARRGCLRCRRQLGRLPAAQLTLRRKMSMRALIVCYVFPPVGGAGVQRVLKLVKYLPRYGITPSVLTARAPSVPLVDPSLVSDVPPGTEVVRVRTFEPGYAAKQMA